MSLLLRKFVRLVLNEAAATITNAEKQGLALYTSGGTSKRTYMLYDADGLIDALEKEEMAEDDPALKLLDPLVYAVVVTAGKPGNAWGASMIEFSAAREGFGPMMYDVVMAHEDGLMADRHLVSSSAKEVWQFYKSNRKDVEAKPLDDERQPTTPPEDDDARLHPGGTKNALNYAYFLKDPPNVESLLARHKEAMPALRRLGVNRTFLAQLATNFFDKRYKG